MARSRDDHIHSIGRIEDKVQSLLSLTRQAFEESDAAAESALKEAIARITRGHNERDLDKLVAEALEHLSNIGEMWSVADDECRSSLICARSGQAGGARAGLWLGGGWRRGGTAW